MKRLFMQEVATRDGFQNEKNFIQTDEKISLINELSQCGYTKIEVTSFTSPKAIPALRDAEAVMAGIACLLYTSPSPRDKRQSRMPSSA